MGDNRVPRLLILNQMAGPLTWELAEDLGKALGSVALLTGHPDTLAKGSQSGVQLYPAIAYQRDSYARRVFTWLVYCLQAFLWVWRFPSQVPLLVFSNPPFLCWLGYVLKRLRGQSYAVMVHDIYPDILVGLKKIAETHPLVRLWRRLNRVAYENAQVVMTLGDVMADNLAKQFDAEKTRAGRVHVVYPWVDTDLFKPIPKTENWFAQKYNQVDKLTVMYSGNMGLGHDIETILAAAWRLRDDPHIHFMFIGAGPKWKLVDETIHAERLTNVTLLPWQPEEILPYVFATADVGVVSLDDGLQGLAVPSKTFYMMAVGAAILGLSKRPSDLQLVIERYQCGVCVEPGDVEGLAQAVVRYRDDENFLAKCRQSARLAAENHFSRVKNTHRILCDLGNYVARG